MSSLTIIEKGKRNRKFCTEHRMFHVGGGVCPKCEKARLKIKRQVDEVKQWAAEIVEARRAGNAQR